MIQYEGMKAEENRSDSYGQLPAGPYVGKVLKVEIVGDRPNQSLILSLDVADGEYQNFYINKFLAAKAAGSKFGEVKYKGTYRLRIPNKDNTKDEYPETTLKRFNDMIFRFEKSNNGYHWDGDEQKLVNLTVGFSVQDDSYNGNAFTRIARLDNAQDVRDGKVKTMRPRQRKGEADDSQYIDPQTGFVGVETVELPFD